MEVEQTIFATHLQYYSIYYYITVQLYNWLPKIPSVKKFGLISFRW